MSTPIRNSMFNLPEGMSNCNLIHAGAGSVSIEDLSTYTEVDAESNLVVTTSKVVVTDMHTEHVDTYLYKDFTASYFGTNFEVDFEFVVTDPNHGDDTSDFFGIISFVNTIGTYLDCDAGPNVFWTPDVDADKIRLNCGDKTVAESYLTFDVTPTTVFYCTIKRVKPSSGDCSVLIDVYSNSERTVRMNKSDGNPSIQYGRNDIPAIYGAYKYRYLQLAAAERDSFDTTPYGSYYVQNVKIISNS